MVPADGSEPGMPTASVLICAYTEQRWDDICRGLASLRAQTRLPLETILICDHNDELLERARAAFGDVVVAPNTQTRGLSGARNTGIGLAAGDVVAFLDDDAAADPDWLERLLAPYADPAVVGVYGAVRPAWGAPRPAWLPQEFLWVLGCSFSGQPAVRTEVRNGIGANMSFRREVFGSVGGFDPSVGRIGKDAAGCEETEFSIRVHRLRPESVILLEPAALVSHAVTPERLTRRYFRRRCQAEGRSKAVVSRLAGSADALSSERTYTTRVLPRGVLRGLTDLARGDTGGLTRAASIIGGLGFTASSYVLTSVSLGVRARRQHT